eukprot:TRINITY_DN4648_c0_g1_i1.p1 TRINITY_DN4648_c0_g1~~TRINITY_DN4648_c0_g1_i1.p1  ORF type:complete len:375 (-),score=106.29 TRINITY_DN4648_c0_g1_i1:74-1198(-)
MKNVNNYEQLIFLIDISYSMTNLNKLAASQDIIDFCKDNGIKFSLFSFNDKIKYQGEDLKLIANGGTKICECILDCIKEVGSKKQIITITDCEDDIFDNQLKILKEITSMKYMPYALIHIGQKCETSDILQKTFELKNYFLVDPETYGNVLNPQLKQFLLSNVKDINDPHLLENKTGIPGIEKHIEEIESSIDTFKENKDKWTDELVNSTIIAEKVNTEIVETVKTLSKFEKKQKKIQLEVLVEKIDKDLNNLMLSFSNFNSANELLLKLESLIKEAEKRKENEFLKKHNLVNVLPNASMEKVLMKNPNWGDKFKNFFSTENFLDSVSNFIYEKFEIFNEVQFKNVNEKAKKLIKELKMQRSKIIILLENLLEN